MYCSMVFSVICCVVGEEIMLACPLFQHSSDSSSITGAMTNHPERKMNNYQLFCDLLIIPLKLEYIGKYKES